MKEEFVLFWNGPFSQWTPATFKVDNVEYNCAEQYMMAQKALLFDDKESYEKILGSNDPKTQKHLGRAVKGFDPFVWETKCKEIVCKGNFAKFSQNENLKNILLETENKTLVEASPYDKIWGIGLPESDPRCLDKNLWQGKNYLGECLMIVREAIFNNKQI